MRRFSAIAILIGSAVLGCGARTELANALASGELLDAAASPGAASPCGANDACDAGSLPRCDPNDAHLLAITSAGELYSVSPETLLLEHLGRLNCPTLPISMTISRDRTLWLGTADGRFLQASSADLSCVVADSSWLPPNTSANGSGLTVDAQGVEHLFVAPSSIAAPSRLVQQLIDLDPSPPRERARLPLVVLVSSAELVGTGDGRLFMIARAPSSSNEVTLQQLDARTAQPLWQVNVSPVSVDGFCNGCDIAYWNQAIYVFNGVHANDNRAQVWRYSLAQGTMTELGLLPIDVVGVDAPPCSGN